MVQPVDQFPGKGPPCFLTFTTLTILAGGLLAAADASSVTYVKGTIDELSPNTGGTLVNTAKSMEIRTPLHSVQVPYSQISKAELGAIQSHTPETDAPYKVWTLHKRFMTGPQTQEMTVAFTNEKGQDQSMTIEKKKKTASTCTSSVIAARSRIPLGATTTSKTTRNKDTGAERARSLRSKTSYRLAGDLQQGAACV
jgi:hypothetical protein